MKLGYTIIYVPDVAESLSFFENAFGFSRRFLHADADYGELATGETTLAFASHKLGNANQGLSKPPAKACPGGREHDAPRTEMQSGLILPLKTIRADPWACPNIAFNDP